MQNYTSCNQKVDVEDLDLIRFVACNEEKYINAIRKCTKFLNYIDKELSAHSSFSLEF